MVRRCAVLMCESTDKTTMSHRFPRKIESALKWQESLQLQNIKLVELIQKYVVCTHHFKPSDYRNSASKHLNFTAVPTLYVSQSHTDTTEEPITLPSDCNASSCTTTNDAEQLMNLELYRTEPDKCTNSEDADRPGETFDKSMSTYFCEDTDQHMIDHPNQFSVESDLNASPSYSNDLIEIVEEDSVTFCSYEPPEEDVIQEERPEDTESDCLYVEEEELFETVEELSPTEDLAEITKTDKPELEDSNEPLLYRQMSRLALVQNLIQANEKIAELECKLNLFESAHSALLNNFESFKSLLKP